MDIIKEFQKYPKAWEAFWEWYIWESEINTGEQSAFATTPPLLQLTIMQAWLDSEGTIIEIWVEGSSENGEAIIKFDYSLFKKRGEWLDSIGKHDNVFARFPARPEALKAAVLKGCEVFENQLKTK